MHSYIFACDWNVLSSRLLGFLALQLVAVKADFLAACRSRVVASRPVLFVHKPVPSRDVPAATSAPDLALEPVAAAP